MIPQLIYTNRKAPEHAAEELRGVCPTLKYVFVEPLGLWCIVRQLGDRYQTPTPETTTTVCRVETPEGKYLEPCSAAAAAAKVVVEYDVDPAQAMRDFLDRKYAAKLQASKDYKEELSRVLLEAVKFRMSRAGIQQGAKNLDRAAYKEAMLDPRNSDFREAHDIAKGYVDTPHNAYGALE